MFKFDGEGDASMGDDATSPAPAAPTEGGDTSENSPAESNESGDAGSGDATPESAPAE